MHGQNGSSRCPATTSATYSSADMVPQTWQYPGRRLPPTIRHRFSATTQRPGNIGQRMREAMVLVVRIHEDIGPVERVADRVVIGEAAVSGEHVPGIVNVEVGQHEPQGKVDAGHAGSRQMFGDELPLRINGVMLGQLRFGVGCVVRIYLAADFADRRRNRPPAFGGWRNRLWRGASRVLGVSRWSLSSSCSRLTRHPHLATANSEQPSPLSE